MQAHGLLFALVNGRGYCDFSSCEGYHADTALSPTSPFVASSGIASEIDNDAKVTKRFQQQAMSLWHSPVRYAVPNRMSS